MAFLIDMNCPALAGHLFTADLSDCWHPTSRRVTRMDWLQPLCLTCPDADLRQQQQQHRS